MSEVIQFKPTKPAEPACNFCGKKKSQVTRMIRAETGYCICNECVAVCKERMESERG